jgi:hypothetical protein
MMAQLHATLPPANVPAPRSLQRCGGDYKNSHALQQTPDVSTIDTLHLKRTVLLQVQRKHRSQIAREAAVAVTAPRALQLGSSVEHAIVFALKSSGSNK